MAVNPVELPCGEVEIAVVAFVFKIVFPARQVVVADKTRPDAGGVVVERRFGPDGDDAARIVLIIVFESVGIAVGAGIVEPVLETQRRV